MDFLDKCKQYIEDNLNLFVDHINVGLLRDGNDVAIRATPGNPPERYMDDSHIYNYQYQVLVKHQSPREAYDTAREIEFLLDGLKKDAITGDGFTFIKSDVYTPANFVEHTSTGEHIYTAMFQAELLREE